MSEITLYPNNPINMYRVSFDMKLRGVDKKLVCTAIFPAVSEEAARDAITSFCWGVNEATNHQYITDGDRQIISVFEVNKAYISTENTDVDA